MQNSNIEWTDHTFNPWIGCTKVSPGCKNCYAETYGNRFGVQWGPQGERKRTSPAYWRKPLAWNNASFVQCDTCGWRGSKRGMAYCPACHGSTCTPTRQRVFCASLADVFEDRPELIPWRAELFDLIANTPNLDWLLLTKRPELIRRLQGGSTAGPWYDALGRHRGGGGIGGQMFSRVPSGDINWVIAGGESGPHARPMHPDWARSLRDQCTAAGVPFFFKQWGEHLPRGQWNVHGMESLMYAAGCEAFGGTAPPRSIQWDEEMWAYKVGKHDAGRYLDERIHNAHPPLAPR